MGNNDTHDADGTESHRVVNRARHAEGADSENQSSRCAAFERTRSSEIQCQFAVRDTKIAKPRYREMLHKSQPQCTRRMHRRSTKHQKNRMLLPVQDQARTARINPPSCISARFHTDQPIEDRVQEGNRWDAQGEESGPYHRRRRVNHDSATAPRPKTKAQSEEKKKHTKG